MEEKDFNSESELIHVIDQLLTELCFDIFFILRYCSSLVLLLLLLLTITTETGEDDDICKKYWWHLQHNKLDADQTFISSLWI